MIASPINRFTSPAEEERPVTPEKKRLRVGVLFGGRSGEHEVSLASAASVIRGLDPDKYEPVPIGIAKDGHWLFGEDGTIQGMLELAGLPYVGAGVLGSAIAMDKDVAKRLCEDAGIPVVPWLAVQRWQWEKEPEAVKAAIAEKFAYPVFVKPATLGSSVGMSKVHAAEELAPAVNFAAEYGMKIL